MSDPGRRRILAGDSTSIPRVTVIIPTYNRLSLLREAILSVQTQTYPRVELIVADDGSTDGTEEFCANQLRQYPDTLRHLNLPHSGRPGAVRNAGARIATGEYLVFLDSDDLWKQEKLARQLAFFEKNREFKICHTREIWQRGERIVSQAGQKHQRSGYIFPDALKKCIIGPSTVMLRRELFDEFVGFREDLEIAEDYELWLRITAKYPVGYIDEPLVIKRSGHPNQLSEKYGQIEIFRIKALMLNLEAGTFTGEQQELAARELVLKCRIYAAGCEKRGKTEEGSRYREIAGRYVE